jgi:hypothetical protein
MKCYNKVQQILANGPILRKHVCGTKRPHSGCLLFSDTSRKRFRSNELCTHISLGHHSNKYYINMLINGRAIAQAVSRWLPTEADRFRTGFGQVGFLVDKVELGQVFSGYFGFPC